MIEINKKITSDTVIEIFANIVLTEAITHHHCATGMVPTHKRGSHTIDSIYTSINLQVSSDGYLQFVIIPSDHHLLWLKIEFNYVFGAKMDTLVPHITRKLNFPKPDTIKQFIELYENFIR